jgi:hypothetical protein
LLCLSGLLVSTAAAQAPQTTPAPAATPAPATGAPDAAREHFKRGEANYQKGSYAAAITEWEAAYTADPRPRIQYNIFQAYERLGQLQEASTALQRYLSTADPDDPYYSDATARMAALQQRLQATGIKLSGGVDGASINVSGHDWGRLPRPDRIAVQPGNHRIVISLSGYRDFVANVVVPAGQVVEVPIQLDPLESAAPATAGGAGTGAPAGATGAPPTDQEDHASGTPFYIAAGILGAGAIGSAVWAFDRVSELKDCDSPDTYCSEEDAVTTQRNIAFGLTAVLGVGAIGALIYGLVVDGAADDRVSVSTSTAALCMPAALGATCRVQF